MANSPDREKTRALLIMRPVLIIGQFCKAWREPALTSTLPQETAATKQPDRPLKRKFQNSLWLPDPTQLPTQGQWWSILMTHSLQMEQWWERGGLITLHLKQKRQSMRLDYSGSNMWLTSVSIRLHSSVPNQQTFLFNGSFQSHLAPSILVPSSLTYYSGSSSLSFSG